MQLRKSSKYIIAGVFLIILGVLLNEMAIWIYYWLTLADPGNTPPPIAPIAGTIFLVLVPLGLVIIIYGLYLRWMESQQDIM